MAAFWRLKSALEWRGPPGPCIYNRHDKANHTRTWRSTPPNYFIAKNGGRILLPLRLGPKARLGHSLGRQAQDPDVLLIG